MYELRLGLAIENEIRVVFRNCSHFNIEQFKSYIFNHS
jgi:hypothetical protein